jgi:CHRD domain
MRIFTWVATAILAAGGAPAFAHLAEGTVQMTATAEVPTPTGVSANAGGTATFELQDDKTLTYEVTVHDLTGPAIAGHIHEGAPGVAGGIIFPFTQTSDTTFMGTTPALTDDQVQKLLSGAFYVNVHTGTNPLGEIRGQMDTIAAVQGTCSCASLSRKDFRKCVANEIKKLDKSQKKSAEVKALRRAVKKSSCGLTATPKKKPLACCLPANDVAEIVTDALCAPIKKDAQCTPLGGTVKQAGCVPNPCTSSPSGAFLD